MIMAEQQRYQTLQTPVPSSRVPVAERLRLWRGKITHAKALRTSWERRFRLKELEQYYLGDETFSEAALDESWFNQFFATLQSQLPNLFYAMPSFKAVLSKTDTPFGGRDASIIEALLQQIAAEGHNLEEDGKLALLQAFFRVGCLKACYYPQLTVNPAAGQQMEAEVAGHTELLTNEDGSPLLEGKYILTDEQYSWDWVDARKLLFPDQGPRARKWTWIGEEIEVTLEEAQEDSRFPAGLRQQFVANAHVVDSFDMGHGSVAAPMSSAADDDPGLEGERFRYVECWDRRHQRLYILAEGQPFSDEQFLLDEPYPDGIVHDPYSILAFLPLVVGPRPLPWPMPMVWNWSPLQREYNHVRQQITTAANRAARKMFYDAGVFRDSEEARKAMSSSVDMEGVEVMSMTVLPQIMDAPQLNVDVTGSMAALQYDWRVVTGATGQRLGGVQDGNTATEAAITEKGATLRETNNQAAVVAWLGDAGTKMYELVRQTLTTDMYVRMRGFGDKEFAELLQSPGFQQVLSDQFGPQLAAQLPQLLPLYPALQKQFREKLGREHLLRVTRDVLQAQAEITVLPTSLRARSMESDRALWLQFLQVLGQFPQLMQSRALLEETAEKFDGLSDAAVDELFLMAQKQQQMQAQQAQLQMQAQQVKMQADLAKVAMSHPTGAAMLQESLQGQGQGGQAPQQAPQPNGQLPQASREAL